MNELLIDNRIKFDNGNVEIGEYKEDVYSSKTHLFVNDKRMSYKPLRKDVEKKKY